MARIVYCRGMGLSKILGLHSIVVRNRSMDTEDHRIGFAGNLREGLIQLRWAAWISWSTSFAGVFTKRKERSASSVSKRRRSSNSRVSSDAGSTITLSPGTGHQATGSPSRDGMLSGPGFVALNCTKRNLLRECDLCRNVNLTRNARHVQVERSRPWSKRKGSQASGNLLGLRTRPYAVPACFLRAAQRAFISADNFFRAAGLIWGRPAAFFAVALVVLAGDLRFFRAAQRAFIASEIRLRAAALMTRRPDPVVVLLFGGRPRRGADGPSRAEIA